MLYECPVYLLFLHSQSLCIVREGQKSPGNRRRQRPHDKSSESSSLSSSAVNQNGVNTGSDKENIQHDGHDVVDDEMEDDVMEADVKTDREIHELSKMTDSGAAMVILEDLRKKKLEKASLDPRSSSRTPSAAAEPPYRPRYDSPLFACEHYTLRIHLLSISASHPGQLSLLPLAGREMSTSQSVVTLQLGSKGRYGSFHPLVDKNVGGR